MAKETAQNVKTVFAETATMIHRNATNVTLDMNWIPIQTNAHFQILNKNSVSLNLLIIVTNALTLMDSLSMKVNTQECALNAVLKIASIARKIIHSVANVCQVLVSPKKIVNVSLVKMIIATIVIQITNIVSFARKITALIPIKTRLHSTNAFVALIKQI